MLVDADASSHPQPKKTPAKQPPKEPPTWVRMPSVVSWFTATKNLAGNAEKNEVDIAVERVRQEAESEKVVERLNAARVIEEFMQDSASQLTYYGLMQLHSVSVLHEFVCVYICTLMGVNLG